LDRSGKALEVAKRLDEAFGCELPRERRELTNELIHAVLSQNTSRNNYDLAYRRLMERFPSAEEIAGAPLGEIEEAIRPGGLSRQKSETIKNILMVLGEERGDYSLDFLRDMSVAEARAYLTTLPGVGPKTASIVLMFGMGRKVLPVDTHVLRTAKRIGLIDPKTTAEKAEAELEALVTPEGRPRMHLNMVRLGREICHARNPRHEICPVNMLCDYLGSAQ
jgi:endonuclease-3